MILLGTNFVTVLFFASCDNDDSSGHPLFEATVESTTFSTAKITWTPLPGVINYSIYLETELITDTVTTNSFILTGLIGDLPYSGKVVATTSKGEVTAFFSFIATIADIDPVVRIAPKGIVVVNRAFLGSHSYDYKDSIRYQFIYGTDNRVTTVSKFKRKYGCGYNSCSTWVLKDSLSERFEFAYLSRRMTIERYDNNNNMVTRATFGFNNDSYVLPGYAGIRNYFGQTDPIIDSMVFLYSPTHFVQEAQYFSDHAYQRSDTFSEHRGNLYINVSYDSLSVDYTDHIATINQFSGIDFPIDPDAYWASPDVLFYPVSIFRNSGKLASHLMRPGPGNDQFTYNFIADTLRSFRQDVYDGNSSFIWSVYLEY